MAIYQCTHCKRKKSFTIDDTSVFINTCTLTKACEGRLFLEKKDTKLLINEQSTWTPTSTAATAAVDDTTEAKLTYLTNNSNGGVTLALPSTYTDDVYWLKLQQSNTLSGTKKYRYQKYTYTIYPTIKNIRGRDKNGSILRINDFVIQNQMVDVYVNGVKKDTTFFTLDVDVVHLVTPMSVMSTVDVYVYESVNANEKFVQFQKNSQLIFSEAVGAWSNISYITDASGQHWNLYSAVSILPDEVITNLSSFNIMTLTNESQTIDYDGAINSGFFVLSDYPYKEIDRRHDAIIRCDTLKSGYQLGYNSTYANQFFVLTEFVTGIYPSFSVEDAAYVFPTINDVNYKTEYLSSYIPSYIL